MKEAIVKSGVLKGGEFVYRQSKHQSVFIPEEENEDQQMIRSTCNEFVVNEILANIIKLDKQEDNIAAKLLEQAGELGLLSSHLPESYGGMDLDTNTNTIICEEMGKAASFSVTFAAHTGIGTLPILYYGTEEQKQFYLPKLSTGELKSCYCLTEPGSGSDALAAKTRADLSEDGRDYILNGQKMWISNSGFADIFIVFAKIDGDKFTGFIVERDSEGLTLGAEEDKLGIKGSSTRQVFFENVKVPVENVLGEIGKGHLIAFNVLNVGRFKLALMALGASKDNITMAVKYANERVQFGVPISTFGAIKLKLSQQVIRSFVLESAAYRTSQLIQSKIQSLKAAGRSSSEAKLEAAEEYAIECAILKVDGSETMDYAVDETVQIFGGNGFSEEYGAARSYRDSRISRIYEGTNEINRLLTVSMLIKRAMSGHLNLMEVLKQLAEGRTIELDESNGSPAFEEELATLSGMKKLLLTVLGTAMKHQQLGTINLKKDQEISMYLADIIIDVFNSDSVLLRIMKMRQKGVDYAEVHDILHVHFNDALARIQKNVKDALASICDDKDFENLQKVTGKLATYKKVNVMQARRKIADRLISGNEYCY